MKKFLLGVSVIVVSASKTFAAPPPDEVHNITAAIPYFLQYASGEYAIWYKTGNGNTTALTKPVIVIEGIDFFENDPQWLLTLKMFTIGSAEKLVCY